MRARYINTHKYKIARKCVIIILQSLYSKAIYPFHNNNKPTLLNFNNITVL